MNLPPPILPDWHPRRELSRPSAEQISRGENTKQTLIYAGANAVIPVVYGEQVVGGPVISGPVLHNGAMYVAVALSHAGNSARIERIEDLRIGGEIVSLPAITIGNTGALASLSGVTARVYDGRQNTPDAWLSAAIPGFSDSFNRIAYAVMQCGRPEDLSKMMSATFRVKGVRCRPLFSGGSYAWTENPVLHMNDFVRNPLSGMGLGPITGAEEAAAVADSLYSGLPRSRTGLTLQDPMTESDALALFAQYAEVLWSYDGNSVSIIPDAPVGTIHDIPAGWVREGSLSMSTAGLEEIPTQVRIEFVDRADPEWASRPAVAEVPAHTTHGMPTAPSSVPLPGVYNRLEAERRAYQRLMRLQTPGRVEWQMFAPGMPYQAGDVVRLPDIRGLQSVDVRLTAQPEMIAPLLYQMGGEIYRASSYPSGGEGISVPTGAILILRGNGPVPEGWEEKNYGNRLIREGAPGNAGSSFSVSASISSSSAGGHVGTESIVNDTDNLNAWSTGSPFTGTRYYTGGDSAVRGAHSHGSVTVSTAATNTVRRYRMRMIKRTGGPTLAPEGVSILSAGGVSDVDWVDATPTGGGYLAHGSSEEVASPTTSLSRNLPSAGVHDHGGLSRQAATSQPSGSWGRVARWLGRADGSHLHTARASVSASLRSVALAVLDSSGGAPIPESGIVGWEDSTASIPDGWALCNGQNGTVDLRNRFIYLSATQAGEVYQTSSQWSISGTGTDTYNGHDHVRRVTVWSAHPNAPALSLPIRHSYREGAHFHSMTGGASGSLDNIQRYHLHFIQYIGGQ